LHLRNEKANVINSKICRFCLFQRVVEIISNKIHLSMEGLQKIINIKAAMNKGLSNELKSNFFNVNIVDRLLILTKNIVDNN
jgi:superfamily II helicase